MKSKITTVKVEALNGEELIAGIKEALDNTGLPNVHYVAVVNILSTTPEQDTSK